MAEEKGTFLERFVKVMKGERNGKVKLSKRGAKERERKALQIRDRERERNALQKFWEREHYCFVVDM